MPRPMSPEECVELGRRYYSLKQYDKALEIFSTGIETSPSLSLYDHRAACYDRLKDYNAAVKDGREMIRLEKQDVKGYLRTASILQKMDKPDTALGIYKYGMKNVPVSDKNFKLLQQLHDKVTRKLAPAKAIDPLAVLPVELAEMVLEHLAFRNMVNCMRVSKGWRDYLSNRKRLWLHLDLSDAKRPVSRSFVDKAVRRSQYRLNRFTVHRFQHLDVVVNVARACKELSDIELLSLPHQASASLIEIARRAIDLKRYVLHTELSIDTIQQILYHRPTLEHAEFRSILGTGTLTVPDGQPALKNLHTLRFSGQGNHRLEVAYNLFRKTPALETLVVTNLASTNMPIYGIPLKVLVLKGPNIVAVPLPTTLERFTWEPTNTILSHITFGHVMNSHLPSLTHLSLSNVESVSAKWLSSILDSGVDEDEHDNQDIPVYVFTENAVPLQHLSIKGTLDQSTTSLFRRPDPASGQPRSLFTGSARILTPALKHLAIADLPCDDDEIEHLVSYNLRLEYIDLSASNITGASIKMLADGIPTLKHIRADSASRINGRDGIEYAERKGIKVSCSMGKRQFGKKIRYLY